MEKLGVHKKRIYVFGNIGAAILGIVIGLMVGSLSDEDEAKISMPGEWVTSLLQLVIVLLPVTGLMRGVFRLKADNFGKEGLHAAQYIVYTTFLAVTAGLAFVVVIKPGVGSDSVAEDAGRFVNVDGLLDLLRNMIPSIIVHPVYRLEKSERMEFSKIDSVSGEVTTEIQIVESVVNRANFLGMTICSFAFSMGIKQFEENGGVMSKVIIQTHAFATRLANFLQWYLPCGVFCMIFPRILGTYDWEVAIKLAKFIGASLVVLVIHGAIVLPTMYLLFLKCNFAEVIKRGFPPLMGPLVTPFSASTTAHISQFCEDTRLNSRNLTCSITTNYNISVRVLYLVMAVAFTFQVNDIYLDLPILINIGITAAVTSLGSREIQEGGGAIIFFVLHLVGVPPMEAGILVLVEWLLGRLYAVVQILGDFICVAVIEEVSRIQRETFLATPQL